MLVNLNIWELIQSSAQPRAGGSIIIPIYFMRKLGIKKFKPSLRSQGW